MDIQRAALAAKGQHHWRSGGERGEMYKLSESGDLNFKDQNFSVWLKKDFMALSRKEL